MESQSQRRLGEGSSPLTLHLPQSPARNSGSLTILELGVPAHLVHNFKSSYKISHLLFHLLHITVLGGKRLGIITPFLKTQKSRWGRWPWECSQSHTAARCQGGARGMPLNLLCESEAPGSLKRPGWLDLHQQSASVHLQSARASGQ